MDQTGAIVMPKLGLTMTEGMLSEWKVAAGQAFKAGEVLFVVETDKIANEVEAEAGGVIGDILVSEGETVPVGTPLARLREADVTSASMPDRSTGAAGGDGAGKPKPAAQDKQGRAIPARPAAGSGAPRVIATPLARRLARTHGIDLREVRGSGPRGRIKAADVTAAASVSAPRLVSQAPVASAEDVRERLSGTQAAVARRLTAAKQEIPHFYAATEAEISSLLELRQAVNDAGGWPHTTLTHWIVAAVGRVLRDRPAANRIWDDGELLTFAASDVGVAIESGRGLYAPMVRDAGRCSVGEIADRLDALRARAEEGRLQAADLEGGSITVSNVGMHDITYLTPIINPGQAMILGVGTTRELFRPDGSGQPALRRELGLVLAADHRVINGVEAAAFLGAVVRLLEQPLQLLTVPL